VKVENGSLLSHHLNIRKEWNKYFSKLLNVYRVSDVRQLEIAYSKPFATEHSLFEVETAISKLEKYESPGSEQILAELIKAGGEAFALLYFTLLYFTSFYFICVHESLYMILNKPF
jgi:hypothetical protein